MRYITTDTIQGLATGVQLRLRQNTALSLSLLSLFIATLLAVVDLPEGPVDPGEEELLRAQHLTQSLELSWTAPGDDGDTGQATQYNLRYSTDVLSEGNWSSATEVPDLPTPAPAGTEESFLISGLEPKTTYFFGLKSVDEAGNWSSLSNVVSKLTSCTEDWTCGEWSACTDGVQTRTCTDSEACGTERYMPATTQECGLGGPPPASDAYVVHVPNTRAKTVVRTFDNAGNLLKSFLAYTSSTRGDLGAITADVDGDGDQEIVTYLGEDSPSHIRVFSEKGRLIGQFFAYPTGFRGGVLVNAADMDGDGKSELVVRPRDRARAVVNVYRYNTSLKKFQKINSVLAAAQNFRGKTSLTTGDVDGDGTDEFMVASAGGGLADVRAFRYNPSTKKIEKFSTFRPYAAPFRGGVVLASGNISGDAADEIVTGTMNGSSNVRVYRFHGPSQKFKLVDWVLAYGSSYRKGVELTLGDVNADGRDEILTVPAEGGPNVRAYTYKESRKDLRLLDWFQPYPSNFRGGVALSIANLDGDVPKEIVVTPKRSGGSNVSIYEYDPASHQVELVDHLKAFGSRYAGAIQAKVADLDADGQSEIITTRLSNGAPNARVYFFTGSRLKLDYWYYAFQRSYTGGVRTTTGLLPPA